VHVHGHAGSRCPSDDRRKGKLSKVATRDSATAPTLRDLQFSKLVSPVLRAPYDQQVGEADRK
jgi:hypothetical protein